jgi:predicted metal-binding membrane protein
MIYNAREYARLRNCVLAISLIAWIVILLKPGTSSCCAPGGSVMSLETLLALNPPVALARDWGLMLIAMMAPTLVPALYHIRISSFAARRARSTAFFAAGYGAVWMAAGGVMLAIALGATWCAPQSYLPAIVVGAVALAWQGSPFKQRCLNRAHSHRALAAFGAAADWDVFRMGLEHGLWCTGSCWAAMLFPILLPEGHFIAMVAVSTLMFCERLDPPKTPSWRWRGFATAIRYLSLRLRGPRSGPAPFAMGAPA